VLCAEVGSFAIQKGIQINHRLVGGTIQTNRTQPILTGKCLFYQFYYIPWSTEDYKHPLKPKMSDTGSRWQKKTYTPQERPAQASAGPQWPRMMNGSQQRPTVTRDSLKRPAKACASQRMAVQAIKSLRKPTQVSEGQSNLTKVIIDYRHANENQKQPRQANTAPRQPTQCYPS
jgi:hypothetical protein